MPRRQRWTPVRGTGNRISDPWERALLGALDLPGRAAFALGRLLGLPRERIDPGSIRDVLVLRLDRIGDLLMSFPALAGLRERLPEARIRLAVGRWSEDIARTAPVDEVLLWSAPWAGRASEGAESFHGLARKAIALRKDRPELAIDLQGDVRASILMALTGARLRVGYGNTGGAYLLTHVVPLDETVSWVDQNRRAISHVLGGIPEGSIDPLTAADKDFAQRLLENLSLGGRRPLVGIHPSGGRRIKQWDVLRFQELGRRLQGQFGATLLITGSEADRPLASLLARGMPSRPLDFTGRLSVRETMALIATLDLFLSCDTGPMHMACAVGTPSVSIFGPSDPGRYFSGGPGTPGSRHVVVRADLWCSPCNLIRRPPEECDTASPPECLRLVAVDEVQNAAARLLKEVGGYAPRSQTPS
jgi:ADP-heptose:LPS heptosyltransferase